MKKIIKLIIIIITMSSIIIIYPSNVFANNLSLDRIITQADNALQDFNEAEIPNAVGVNTINLMNESKIIYRTLFIIGMIITVIVGVFIGIKFITASVEGKAQVKEMFIPYAIGSIVIFGAYTIWSIVVNGLSTTI